MIYVLFCNDMRWEHYENVRPIAWAETEQELRELVEHERVAMYSEPGHNHYGPVTWGKSFRKGGPLEWFNDPFAGSGGIKPIDGLVVINGILHRPAEPIDVPSVSQLKSVDVPEAR